ncbi:MAG: hypothetical protein Q7T73_04380 [Beijerinckiaceae bacterium]|jgi:hypothetical protein|nr:hypothetical protein [Beijerinckiaceae bacterium]
MAVTTYFVVQSFVMKRGRLAGERAQAASSLKAAEGLAARLSATKPAVLAFSRTGDPETDDFEPAQIIARYGDVPDEALEALSQ